MKFFAVILCLIPLYSCSGEKRKRSSLEDTQNHQHPFNVTLLKDAFKYLPDEILEYIFNFLPSESQASLSSVSLFWFKKNDFFREKKLNLSKEFFIKMTSSPSRVPFQELFQVINYFTKHWEILCKNSKNPNFLNERPEIEARFGSWLSANIDQIGSPDWNISLDGEGNTLSYIILQQLLLSPFLIYTIQHPIWDSMAIHNETRIRAVCDLLLKIPIILGKVAFLIIVQHIGGNGKIDNRLVLAAIKRGIDPNLHHKGLENSITYTNNILQQILLLEDIHIEIKILAHLKVYDSLLRLESIILKAIETGSINILENEFAIRVLARGSANYSAIQESLISNGFELVNFNSCESLVYAIPIMAFVIAKNPHFLPFLFQKALKSQVPNRDRVLMFLCSSIPNGFKYQQIDIVAIVSSLSSIVSNILPLNTLEDFGQIMTKETQIHVFKHIIKKEISRLVSNWKEKSIKESYICFEQELKNAALFFSTAPLVFPFLYYPTPSALSPVTDEIQTKAVSIKNNVGLYFLAKIGYTSKYRTSSVSCTGQMISADKFKLTLPRCPTRKLTLPDGTEMVVFY